MQNMFIYTCTYVCVCDGVCIDVSIEGGARNAFWSIPPVLLNER